MDTQLKIQSSVQSTNGTNKKKIKRKNKTKSNCDLDVLNHTNSINTINTKLENCLLVNNHNKSRNGISRVKSNEDDFIIRNSLIDENETKTEKNTITIEQIKPIIHNNNNIRNNNNNNSKTNNNSSIDVQDTTISTTSEIPPPTDSKNIETLIYCNHPIETENINKDSLNSSVLSNKETNNSVMKNADQPNDATSLSSVSHSNIFLDDTPSTSSSIKQPSQSTSKESDILNYTIEFEEEEEQEEYEDEEHDDIQEGACALPLYNTDYAAAILDTATASVSYNLESKTIDNKHMVRAHVHESFDVLKDKDEVKDSKSKISFIETESYACENGVNVIYKEYESELQMPDIMRLIQKDLSEPYSIYTYRYFIHNWPKLCFLALHDDKCVGAIVCKLDTHRQRVKRGYIAMLAVDKDYRKLKIGTTLVRKAINVCI